MDDAAKKKVVDAIVLKIGGKSKDDEPKDDENETPDDDKPDEGLVAAMQELGEALAKKDYEAAATVFQNALACTS